MMAEKGQASSCAKFITVGTGADFIESGRAGRPEWDPSTTGPIGRVGHIGGVLRFLQLAPSLLLLFPIGASYNPLIFH